jgi:hypothetical protein
VRHVRLWAMWLGRRMSWPVVYRFARLETPRRFEKILQNFLAPSASKLTPFHPDAYNLRLSK